MTRCAHCIHAAVSSRLGDANIRGNEGVSRNMDRRKEAGVATLRNMSSVLDMRKAIIVAMRPVMEYDLRIAVSKGGASLQFMRQGKVP